MDDATACGHPLHIAGLDDAAVTDRVVVLYAAVEHDGDGLEAAMRMIGKSGDPARGIVRAEFIEHQKRIDQIELGRADDALQLDARAVGRGHACYGFGDVSHTISLPG